MSDGDDQIRIYVCPEPTPEEMAAISAAVLAISSQEGNGIAGDTEPAGGGRERWARAGRREVLRSAEWSVGREWRP